MQWNSDFMRKVENIFTFLLRNEILGTFVVDSTVLPRVGELLTR